MSYTTDQALLFASRDANLPLMRHLLAMGASVQPIGRVLLSLGRGAHPGGFQVACRGRNRLAGDGRSVRRHRTI